MTSTYAIMTDWMDEFKEHPERWTNHGRDILVESCAHKTQDKNSSEDNKETNVRYSGYCEECDIGEDDCSPMMNYAYPLEITPDDEAILKVVKNTCLTILENEDTGDYFLALCGGGMDFSQSIALAYIYAQRWIPADLLTSVITQPCFSVGREEYKELAKEMVYQLTRQADNFKSKAKAWEKSLKDFKEQEIKKTHAKQIKQMADNIPN